MFDGMIGGSRRMHTKFALKSGVAFAALMLGMQIAVAQSPTDFNQSSYNYGTINNDLSTTDPVVPAIGSSYFSGGGSAAGRGIPTL